MTFKSGNGSHIRFPMGTILCYLCAVQSTQTKAYKFNLTLGYVCKEHTPQNSIKYHIFIVIIIITVVIKLSRSLLTHFARQLFNSIINCRA
jgi:hypothetical protein